MPETHTSKQFQEPHLSLLVDSIAHNFKVPIQDLRPRILLQLHCPRFSEANSERRLTQIIKKEAGLLQSALEDLKNRYRETAPLEEVSSLELRPLPPKDADLIFGHIHYLRNLPTKAQGLAACHPHTGLPVVAITYEISRWRNARRSLRRVFQLPEAKVIDVSRVYTLSPSPRGAISWTLGRFLSSLRRAEESELILSTAVDTTLGFTGVSYRASGWWHSATAEPRPYTYVDNIYRPASYLHQAYGTANILELRELLGERFSYSDPGQRNRTLIFARTTGRGNRPPSQPPAILRNWQTAPKRKGTEE